MHCPECGEAQSSNMGEFCGTCGHKIPPPQNPEEQKGNVLKEYVWVFVIVAIIVVIQIANYSSETSLDSSYETEFGEISNEVASIYDLEPSIEPLGYFNDPNLFDSEDMSVEDWLSHVIYLQNEPPSSSDVSGSVVKILCEDFGENISLGSGTNFSNEGYILTNYHIIEDKSDTDCIIGFPDPETGLIIEMYWAESITGEVEAMDHDLAILSITEPVFDHENNVFGYYSRLIDYTFPAFNNPEQCKDKPLKLGEEIKVLGYPEISGGALTITNGLVSSLYSPSNYIVTSAKINGGNSGGLAIDSEGCFIGTPVAVYGNIGDDPLGEIIDSEFVVEFMESLPE